MKIINKLFGNCFESHKKLSLSFSQVCVTCWMLIYKPNTISILGKEVERSGTSLPGQQPGMKMQYRSYPQEGTEQTVATS